MADQLPVYSFPTRTPTGVLLGLSAPRLVAVAAAGIVLIVVVSSPTGVSLAAGLGLIGLLLGSAAAKIGGRAVVDWIPVWVTHGWRLATRNNEFYVTPDLDLGLPPEVLDLPGELFGLELHDLTVPSTATCSGADSPGAYGVLVDTFRHRQIAIAEVSAGDLLFCDPSDQQARIVAWGRLLDHVAQSLPEVCRLQVVHTTGPTTPGPLTRPRRGQSGPVTDALAASYADVSEAASAQSQEHRLLLACALDLRAARRDIRQAGGRTEGAARVLMDRATIIEEALRAAGLDVHGWLPASAISELLRVAYDPAATLLSTSAEPDGPTGSVSAGPMGMVDDWSAVRHDSGCSTTLQVVRPPDRPMMGDFLQQLLVGVPARRRMSILYVPTSLDTAERRAQTQQVSAESEQALRARWGFGTSVRQRRHQEDAARREEELVDGRTVFKVVWLITVTALTPGELDVAVGQVEAAGRRCGLELRRLAGTQRQAHGFTLPLCRGAR